jgi:peptidylprolyl isomerase
VTVSALAAAAAMQLEAFWGLRRVGNIMRNRLGLACAATLSLAGFCGLAQADDWVPIAPENELYLEIPEGLVIIEMRPDVAPKAVDRIKKLTRAGFYNGLKFHRVIEGFMAQGGDPKGTGEGGSSEPDLAAEFNFHRGADAQSFGQTNAAESVGILGASVVLTEPEAAQYTHPDGLLHSYMPFCRGVAAMARADNPNSANSQFFIMFSNDYRSLDQQYTPWGKVVYGMDAVDNIKRGEPPSKPDKIVRMRIGSDVPEAERKSLEEMSPSSQGIRDLVTRASVISGGVDPCGIEVPVRVHP